MATPFQGGAVQRLRRAAPYLLALFITMALAYHTRTTRGYVQDEADRPLDGADVLLADEAGIVARTRTDAGGYFRFIHAPIDHERHQLLICAPGHSAWLSQPIAAWYSTYGLGPALPPDFRSMAISGWKHPVPESCGAAGAPLLTSTPQETSMNALEDVLGALSFLLVGALMFGLPIFLVVWLVRTLGELRDGQRRLVQVVSAIHAELREQAARDVWNQKHR
jgi:hypothetical protein